MRHLRLLKQALLCTSVISSSAFAALRLNCAHGLDEPHRREQSGPKYNRLVQLNDIPGKNAKHMGVHVVRPNPRSPGGVFLDLECAREVMPSSMSRYFLDCGPIKGTYILAPQSPQFWILTHHYPATQSDFPHEIYQDTYTCR